MKFAATIAAFVALASAVKGNEGEFLTNENPTMLTTGNGLESPLTKQQRMAMEVPTDEEHFPPNYDPLDDAVCFNTDYMPSAVDSQELYADFAKIFHFGLAFPNDFSEDNNKVSNDRFAAMYLRMCFHDNAVNDVLQKSFSEYVEENFYTSWWTGRTNWIGPTPFMDTSGSDASVLTCAAERHHPNQNYDQTASRVLKTMQSSLYEYTGDSYHSESLKTKYGLSYADLLHNGCIAASIWTTGAVSTDVLGYNPFQFGRKDACHKKYHGWGGNFDIVPLCGPTEVLPGVLDDVNFIDTWFQDRGMSELQWLSLFWTHTLMDNTANDCPVRNLPCYTAIYNPSDQFGWEPGRDEEAGLPVVHGIPHVPADRQEWNFNKTDYYIKDGSKLDYFSHFLNQGSHQFSEDDIPEDLEAGNCHWEVTTEDGVATEFTWPMTRVDCSISKDVANEKGRSNVAYAIEYLAGADDETLLNYLLCSLRMMSTDDPASGAGGACDGFILEGYVDESAGHLFGSCADFDAYPAPVS